jgi:serine/threonine protein kinase
MIVQGRYRILSILGQGGFGCVYKARELRGRRRVVAIKEIDLGMLMPREVIVATDSFNREVSLLSSLNHPGLPTIYTSFSDADHWYLVLQYIKGETLEERLQRSRRGYCSVKEVLRIGQALADALHYLHTHKPPIIFRDVKPSNVMITRRGQIYLIDFGIARRFSPEKKRDTGPLGSPAYAAPEQYGGAQTDARTDIYGLGATLQTLLTGRDPLELAQGLPPMRLQPLPDRLHTLLTSMLETRPEHRPQDMELVAESLAGERRRNDGLMHVLKGLLIGLGFLLWYIFLGLGVQILTQPGAPPFLPSQHIWFVAILNLFPPVVFITTVYQLVMLFFPKKRWQAAGMLLMLLIMFIVAYMGIFPSLFAWVYTIPL